MVNLESAYTKGLQRINMTKDYHNNMTEAEFRLWYRQQQDSAVKASYADHHFGVNEDRDAFMAEEAEYESRRIRQAMDEFLDKEMNDD